MTIVLRISALLIAFVLYSCGVEQVKEEKQAKNPSSIDIDEIAQFASEKFSLATTSLTDSTQIPRNANADGTWHTVSSADWTSGFFSGSLWQLYELTGDEKWSKEAKRWSTALEKEKTSTDDHDLGFQFYCSFGNEIRLTDDRDDYAKDVVLTASNSLMTRFYPSTGVIRSWDWGSEQQGWQAPTIIDNMMNLEMLLWATQVTGDSSYYKVAISHADVTMKNHFREDYSTYHVLDYDTVSAEVIRKRTFQGYADPSMWARGQAWGIYGYTMMYKETKLEAYLEQAQKAADIFINRLPNDTIPYWDFDAPDIPNVPKDASAAAIAASAMLDLATFETDTKASKYYHAATKLLQALSTDKYLSKNTSHQGVLLHSTGHLPGNSEIDVHINYADYYYLEALNRLKKLQNE